MNTSTAAPTLSQIRFHRQSLPTADKVFFTQTSYFQLHPSLPPTNQVRAKYQVDSGDEDDQPATCVVRFPDLNLIVKYGTKVTITEGQTLYVLNTFLKGKVPAPEIFGWHKDGGEVFLYMQLIPGPTLGDMWQAMTQEQKSKVCYELKRIFVSMHSLKQDLSDQFVGSVAGGSTDDYLFAYRKQPNGFRSVKTFNDWYSTLSRPNYGVETARDSTPHPMRALLLDNVPVVLSHADLHLHNVIVSPSDPTKVVGLIDWGQAGWLPAYWDLYKARFIAREGDWRSEFLEKVLSNKDGAVWSPWFYFAHTLGF